MVLDAALLYTQHYKVRIKGKVKQSREWSRAPPLHLGVVAIEKGAFGSPLSKVVNFIYLCFPVMIFTFSPRHHWGGVFFFKQKFFFYFNPLEYSDYGLPLHCYIYNVSADTSFGFLVNITLWV